MNASVDGTKSLASSGVKLTTREQQEDPEENTTTSSMSSLQWAGISDHSTSAVSSVRSSLRRSPRRLTGICSFFTCSRFECQLLILSIISCLLFFFCFSSTHIVL